MLPFAHNNHHVELEAVLRSEDRKELNDSKIAQHNISLLKSDLLTLTAQKNTCKNLIMEIKLAACGPNDTETIDFCDAIKEGIAMAGDDFLYLAKTEQKLRGIHAAVTSSEMKAVNAAIVRLETSAWFGGQAKIDLIQDAVCKVPLSQRLHVLTGTNLECDQVKIELAKRRRYFTNPRNEKNEEIMNNPARSYKNAMKAIIQGNELDSTAESTIVVKMVV